MKRSFSQLTRHISANPWPWAIFTVAFAARLIYLIERAANDPSFAHPLVDELWHWRWAQEIIGGDFWGDDTYFRAPLYGYFLAFLAKITSFLSSPGESEMAQLFSVRALQSLLASGTAVALYTLGKERFSERVGLFAGFGYGLYGTLIFYETMLLIPVLFLFLLVTATLWFMRWRESLDYRQLAYAGLLFGLAAISRPNILLVAPALAALVFWRHLKSRENGGMSAALKYVAILTVTVSLPVFSVTLRNALVTGEATMISSQGGINLYIGNNPVAQGLNMLIPEVTLDESIPWSQFNRVTRKIAERESGFALTAAEESSFWSAKARNYIFANPGEFLALTARKFVYLTLGFENSDNGDIYRSRDNSTLLSTLLWKWPFKFPWGALLPLALIGMILSWRNRGQVLPFYLLLLVYIPTIILFLVTARHRLALVPWLLLFAGVGVFHLLDRVREKRMAALAPLGLVGLLTLVVINFEYFDIGGSNEMQSYMNEGITHERRGDFVSAEASYRQALEYSPESATLWNSLAYTLMRQERAEEAAISYEKAIKLGPNQIEALLNYGQMLLGMTMIDRAKARFLEAQKIAPTDIRPIINIGDLYLKRKDYDSAAVFYREARKLAPEDKEVHFKLGALYARQELFFESEKAFELGAYYGQPTAIAYLNWGNLYLQYGHTRLALAKFQQSLRLNPRLKQAWYSAGMSHYKLKSPPDSVRLYLEVAVKLDPGLTQATSILEVIGAQRGTGGR